MAGDDDRPGGESQASGQGGRQVSDHSFCFKGRVKHQAALSMENNAIRFESAKKSRLKCSHEQRVLPLLHKLIHSSHPFADQAKDHFLSSPQQKGEDFILVAWNLPEAPLATCHPTASAMAFPHSVLSIYSQA